jgi:hypothetical protein
LCIKCEFDEYGVQIFDDEHLDHLQTYREALFYIYHYEGYIFQDNLQIASDNEGISDGEDYIAE